MVVTFPCGGFGAPPPRKFRNMKCSRSDSRHILVLLRVTLCSEPNIFLYNWLKHYIFHSEVGGGVRILLTPPPLDPPLLISVICSLIGLTWHDSQKWMIGNIALLTKCVKKTLVCIWHLFGVRGGAEKPHLKHIVRQTMLHAFSCMPVNITVYILGPWRVQNFVLEY